MTEQPKIKIEFAEGCFDTFEGTQEELDELVAEIHRQIESGEFLENSTAVDLDAMMEDPEEADFVEAIFRSLENDIPKRTLQ